MNTVPVGPERGVEGNILDYLILFSWGQELDLGTYPAEDPETALVGWEKKTTFKKPEPYKDLGHIYQTGSH